MGVHFQGAVLIADGAKRAREIVLGAAPQGEISYVEIPVIPCRLKFDPAVSDLYLRHADRETLHPAQLNKIRGRCSTRSAKLQQTYFVGVIPQELRLFFTHSSIADHGNAFINGFERITDGADSKNTRFQSVCGPLDLRKVVTHSGGQKDIAALKGLLRGLDYEPVISRGESGHMRTPYPCAELTGLFGKP